MIIPNVFLADISSIAAVSNFKAVRFVDVTVSLCVKELMPSVPIYFISVSLCSLRVDEPTSEDARHNSGRNASKEGIAN